MIAIAPSTQSYFNTLPEDRQAATQQLRDTLRQHLPEGFEEAMSYGMPAFVVPHSLYPAGYHCKANETLPFISIASQKNYIAFHHMGLYASPELLDWFTAEWAATTTAKLDMGKGCVRFKKPDAIPYDMVGKLSQKLTPQQWIAIYESGIKK